MIDLRQLQNSFSDLLYSFATPAIRIEQQWQELAKAYSHKNRHYHNLQHLAHLFSLLEEYQELVEDLDVLKCTIWYHDIIYRAGSKKNEPKSADLAFQHLSNTTFASDRIERVCQQIRSTQKHQPPNNRQALDERLLLDMDLDVLSWESDAYLAYCQQIRKEYWLFPNLIYKPGRKAVLQHFLKRPTIYFTEQFKHKEAKARENILAEISLLE